MNAFNIENYDALLGLINDAGVTVEAIYKYGMENTHDSATGTKFGG